MASDQVAVAVVDDEEYDEEADSDFDARASDDESKTSDDDEENKKQAGKKSSTAPPLIEELDSGDEVTIKERKKQRRKQKRNQDDGHISSEGEQDEQWRAKTRSMRAQDKAEKRDKTAVSIKASTIDVNKLWEEMNGPGPLPPIRIEGQIDATSTPRKGIKAKGDMLEYTPAPATDEETITIKRQFEFAGEVHIEEKTVLKSSAEAKLWLAQQENNKKKAESEDVGRQRPLRKISRFDPNYSNLAAFRNDAIKVQPGSFKGPKLNVVEKSKMDWAAHVDASGLKEELDKHSKAKDAYLNRMDFLGEVGQRKEDEAKLARQKG